MLSLLYSISTSFQIKQTNRPIFYKHIHTNSHKQTISTRTTLPLYMSTIGETDSDQSDIPPTPLDIALSESITTTSTPNPDLDPTAYNNINTNTNKKNKLTFSELIIKVKKNKLFTKENLSKLGLNVLLSYGFVSNVSSITCLIISWVIYGKANHISPLAPGKWKGLLAVYAGLYVANSFLRPLRVSLAILISPTFDKFVSKVQTRTHLSRGLSTGIVVFLVNIVGSISYLCGGLLLATTLTGTPLLYKPTVI